LGEPSEDMETRPHWALLAVQAMADAGVLPELSETYEFQVDDEIFHLTAAGGTVSVERGPAAHAVLRVHTDATTFIPDRRRPRSARSRHWPAACSPCPANGTPCCAGATVLGLRDRAGHPTCAVTRPGRDSEPADLHRELLDRGDDRVRVLQVDQVDRFCNW